MCAPRTFDPELYRNRARDAYGALLFLQAQPFVRPDRIGIMVWSQGGGALLFAIGTQSFSRPTQLPRGDFRAAVAFYPTSCDEQRQQPSWSTTIPLMVLVGAEDVGIPAVPCKAFLDGAVTRGAKVEMQMYPGAYHHFDWPNLPRRELPFPTAGGVVRIEGTDTVARQDAFSRVPDELSCPDSEPLRNVSYLSTRKRPSCAGLTSKISPSAPRSIEPLPAASWSSSSTAAAAFAAWSRSHEHDARAASRINRLPVGSPWPFA